MYCIECGAPSQESESFCNFCGRALGAHRQIEKNIQLLSDSKSHLDSQAWPAYGVIAGFVGNIVSVVIFGSGFAWGGWAPQWIEQLVAGICMALLVLGIAYGVGFAIDTSGLTRVEPGAAFKVSAWRFILTAGAAVGLWFWLLQ